jgi:hypothetical protein
MQDSDLFPLDEGQEAARQPSRADRWHPTTFTEPASSDRRRHAGRDRSLLARQAAGDRLPEPLPMLAACHRWSTR